MIALLTWAAVALAAAGALSVCVLALRRLQLARHERLSREAEARLREHALALVDGEPVDVRGLSERETRVLAALLSRYARWLRGAGRERIA